MAAETAAFNERLRHELHKLNQMPPWGRKQGDRWDRLSNFIYRTATLNELWQQVHQIARQEGLEAQAFGAYAVRRWYNYHTHDQLLQMFYAHPDVRPEANARHHTIDFYLRDIPFDLKVSRFPQAYPHDLKHAWQHRHELARWQYEHQSQQGRYHTGNRLFIVLHHRSQPGLTWQLRRDFEALQQQITDFLNAPILLGLTLPHRHTGQIYHPWAGLIFHVK